MPDPAPSASHEDNRSSLWPAIGLFAAVAAAYPVLRGGILWNDEDAITPPALQSWHGLARIWFEVGSTPRYFPILHSLLWLEHRIWGDSTLGYHVVSLLLHALAAFLFGFLLQRLRVPGAWLAAFIFALHPVCVESVAWIAQQKNPLAAVFTLLAALAYLKFDQEREPAPYFAALGLFALALLSSSATAFLPVALLVALWWLRGRLSWWQDVMLLLPWIVLGASMGLFTAWVERTYVGTEGPVFDLGPASRILVAGRAVWFYANKLLWPVDLVPVYAPWAVNLNSFAQYAFPLGAVALLAALWSIRETSRAPLAGVLIFMGALFPVLGFVNVHFFVHSFVADHYAYLASLPLIALLAGGIAVGVKKLPPAGRWVVGAGLVALVAYLGVLTWKQTRIYRNATVFYEAILAQNPDCWIAQANLGKILVGSGDLSAAIPHFESAVRSRPDYLEARDLLGDSLAASGRLSEAVDEYDEALRTDSESAPTHEHLGDVLMKLGRSNEALDHYLRASAAVRDNPELDHKLGLALFQVGRPADAVDSYRRALENEPDSAQLHIDLGNALTAVDRLPDAVQEYREAARLQPDLIEAHFNLGIALLQMGKTADAKDQFQQALRIEADYKPAKDALARLATAPAG